MSALDPFRHSTRRASHRPLRWLAFLLLGLMGQSLSAQTLPGSGVAEVNGTRLYYETAGSGRNVVLIHGGAVDSRAWDDQFAEFARRYRVIRYDLRGAGRSGDRDKPFSNSEDLHALLRHLRIDRAVLVGISRGGGIAFDFALEHPEMVDGLVLVSSNLGAGVPAYSAMFERATEAGRASGAAAAAAVWGNDPFQGPRREAARARVLEILADNMPRFRYFGGYEPVRQLAPSDVPRAERLREIRAPALVICGAHDSPVALTNYRRWAAGIPGARLVVFPEAAHLVNIDQPQEFNRTVLDFLETLDSR